MIAGSGKELLERTILNQQHTSPLHFIPLKPSQQLGSPSGSAGDIPGNTGFLIKKPVNPFVVTQLTLQSKN
jgi:hypothetical protein